MGMVQILEKMDFHTGFPASNDMWGPDEGFMGGKCGPHYGLAPGIHIGASRGSPDILKVGPSCQTHWGPTCPKGFKVGLHPGSSRGCPDGLHRGAFKMGLHPGSTWGPAVDAQMGFKWDL
ncbi:unnamed protein product [Leuciscus chuanchicus]